MNPGASTLPATSFYLADFDADLFEDGVGKVFLRNLDCAIGQKIIYKLFSVYGKIVNCKIAQDETGVNKGYGFVQFDTEEAADKCITMANDMLMNGKRLYVGRNGKTPWPINDPLHIPLTASILAAATPHQRKRMLGERLLRNVQWIYPNKARKITAMLLDIHYSELLHILEDSQALKAAAEQAVAVLEAHDARRLLRTSTNTSFH